MESTTRFNLVPRWWEASLLALILGAALSCTPHHVPGPVPTPTPAPAPPSHPLIAMPDGSWKRGGATWKMRMVVVCCKGFPDADPRDLAKQNNWPLTSKEFLSWISFHQQNATEIRLLMEPIDEHGDLFSPYKIVTPDKKVDLTQWNPEFWTYVDDLLTDGDKKGVVFLVGPIDTWPVDHGMSPWCGKYNVNGVNFCDSGVLRGPFHELGQKFARKSFEELGKHANVIFMDGNESFEEMSGAWTIGQRDLLRQVEAEKGYVRHPYGTQQRDDGLRAAVDFVAVEQDVPVAKWCNREGVCKPTVVNESSPKDPKDVLRHVYKADRLGSSFAFWMGELDEGQRGQTLVALEGWAKGQAIPDWAAVAPKCPLVAGIDVKIHQWICNNQTSPVPCVGGKLVIDSTPLFGKTGSGGRCNDEHDNCGGRQCEPPDGLSWELQLPGGVGSHLQNNNGCGSECPAVPCRDDRGYQPVLDDLRSGHYRIRGFIDGQTDCDGQRLSRGEGVLEFDVP